MLKHLCRYHTEHLSQLYGQLLNHLAFAPADTRKWVIEIKGLHKYTADKTTELLSQLVEIEKSMRTTHESSPTSARIACMVQEVLTEVLSTSKEGDRVSATFTRACNRLSMAVAKLPAETLAAESCHKMLPKWNRFMDVYAAVHKPTHALDRSMAQSCGRMKERVEVIKEQIKELRTSGVPTPGSVPEEHLKVLYDLQAFVNTVGYYYNSTRRIMHHTFVRYSNTRQALAAALPHVTATCPHHDHPGGAAVYAPYPDDDSAELSEAENGGCTDTKDPSAGAVVR